MLAACLQKQNILPPATALSPVVLLCETVFCHMLASNLSMFVGCSSTPVNDRTELNFQYKILRFGLCYDWDITVYFSQLHSVQLICWKFSERIHLLLELNCNKMVNSKKFCTQHYCLISSNYSSKIMAWLTEKGKRKENRISELSFLN